jgi:hypothetical protein
MPSKLPRNREFGDAIDRPRYACGSPVAAKTLLARSFGVPSLSVGAPSVDSRISARLCYRENSFAETFESLGMKFPEPTVNIKEIARKYHHAELEEEKKIEKSKWKELTTEAKRDKVSKKDGKTAPKGEGAKKSERATQHGQEAQLSEVPETKEPEEGDNSH